MADGTLSRPYGSRARGDHGSRRDIDIATEGCPDVDGFAEDVRERLWSLLKVDIVDLDKPISDALLADIRRDGRLLKDLLRYGGDASVATGSPREILKSAYRYFGFIDEDIWLSMLRDRNAIMHIYDGEEEKRLLGAILETYIPAFVTLGESIDLRYGSELESMR